MTEPDQAVPDELTLVYTASGGAGVAVFLKSLLESEGISCVIKTDTGTIGALLLPPMTVPMVGGLEFYDVFVLNRDAQRAREVLGAVETDDKSASVSGQDSPNGEPVKSFGPLVPVLLLGIGMCAFAATIYDLWRGADGLAWVFGPMAVVSLAIGIKMMRHG